MFGPFKKGLTEWGLCLCRSHPQQSVVQIRVFLCLNDDDWVDWRLARGGARASLHQNMALLWNLLSSQSRKQRGGSEMPTSRKRGSAVRRWPFTRQPLLVMRDDRLKGGAGKVATPVLPT